MNTASPLASMYTPWRLLTPWANETSRFYGTGFVALLSNNHLISVSRYEEPRPKLLATPSEGDVHSWTLIPPAYTLSRSVEVLLSIGQTIHVADA
jgi:hypothetical protein